MARPQLAIEGYYDDATCVSQTTDLVLEGKCTGNCDGAIKWTVENMNPRGRTSPLSAQELSQASSGKFITLIFPTST